MADLLHAWDTFWAIPHIRAWLTAGWLLYLAWLGLWIVLQKREPAATLSWLIPHLSPIRSGSTTRTGAVWTAISTTT